MERQRCGRCAHIRPRHSATPAVGRAIAAVVYAVDPSPVHDAAGMHDALWKERPDDAVNRTPDLLDDISFERSDASQDGVPMHARTGIDSRLEDTSADRKSTRLNSSH